MTEPHFRLQPGLAGLALPGLGHLSGIRLLVVYLVLKGLLDQRLAPMHPATSGVCPTVSRLRMPVFR